LVDHHLLHAETFIHHVPHVQKLVLVLHLGLHFVAERSAILGVGGLVDLLSLVLVLDTISLFDE
jgi:hypothetical protein